MEKTVKIQPALIILTLISALVIGFSADALAQTHRRGQRRPAASAQAAPAPKAVAQPAPKPVNQRAGGSSRNQGAVLDFEADVIEGEGKKPDVFLDFNTGASTLDSIVYRRSDFNDRFKDLLKNRLRYQQP
jgi:hypothetical protein